MKSYWSWVSNRDKLCPISACFGKSFSKNVTSHDSNSITVPSSCSPNRTYPFDCSKYLKKIHFFPLGPNFPYLWEESRGKTAKPHGFKTLRLGCLLVHNSYGVEVTNLLGTRLSTYVVINNASP